jgi:hypothetical protein
MVTKFFDFSGRIVFGLNTSTSSDLLELGDLSGALDADDFLLVDLGGDFGGALGGDLVGNSMILGILNLDFNSSTVFSSVRPTLSLLLIEQDSDQ